CVDFGGKPGEFRELEAEQIETVNLFATHNASLSLTIHYLKTNLLADIIVLAIQPKRIAFGDTVSAEIDAALSALEQWFYAHSKEKG
ncbi:MAG: hypothetical protein KKC84_08020, partial [Candidatus Omnitrophica bacterium]|nr:hypothetical protein [Candidatus Omnitrophota bacterium]